MSCQFAVATNCSPIAFRSLQYVSTPMAAPLAAIGVDLRWLVPYADVGGHITGAILRSECDLGTAGGRHLKSIINARLVSYSADVAG